VKVKMTWRRATCLVGLLTGIPALLAGLFALESHPTAGTLLTLAGMALLLSAAMEICQAHEIHEPNLQGKQ